MNRIIFAAAFVLVPALYAAEDASGKYLVGEIKAIVDGPVRTDVITNLDVAWHRFAGEYDLNALILMYAKAQHGEASGIAIEQNDVDRYLRGLAQQGQAGQGFTPDSLRTTARELGCTLDELYGMLKRLYCANITMEQDIHSLLTVTEQEIKAYYEEHPTYKDGVFFLQTAQVPLKEGESKVERKQFLQKNARTMRELSWSMPFDVNESELAAAKQFIKKMKRDDIYVYELSDGFEIYRLKNSVKKHPLTLDEQRKDILALLRDAKFEHIVKQYNEDRLSAVVVTRF